MKRKLITFFIIIICFLLECTVFHRLAFATIKPNLLIIVTSSFGFMRGKKEGLAVGFLSGFLTDVFWGNTLGFYTLLFSVIGYMSIPETDHYARTCVYHSGYFDSVSDHITH